MRRVSVFVVGNSKSGTSALCDYLDQHPDLTVSVPKEPNYFATDFTHPLPEGAFSRLTSDEYEACFASATDASVLVDGSACYLYSKMAARKIAEYNPDAKIVAIFREPVDFLVSYHLQMLRNVAAEGEVIRDLADALAAEPTRKMGQGIPNGCRVPEMLYYRERIKYAEQLKRFVDLFPPENLLVYTYDDFRADNDRVVREVYDLAGVDATYVPEATAVNQASRVRAPRVARAVQDLAHGRGAMAPLHRALTAVAPSGLRRRILRGVTQNLATSGKGTVPEALKRSLKAEFREEVALLGELLGRDLVSHWDYAEVDGGAS